MEVRGDQSAILAVRANPFTHCTGMTGEIAVRSAALRTIRLLIACEQLAHSSGIQTAMQQFAEPVVAKALRDISQQPQMRAVRPFRDEQDDHVAHRFAIWRIERNRCRRTNVKSHGLAQRSYLTVRNGHALTEASRA